MSKAKQIWIQARNNEVLSPIIGPLTIEKAIKYVTDMEEINEEYFSYFSISKVEPSSNNKKLENFYQSNEIMVILNLLEDEEVDIYPSQ